MTNGRKDFSQSISGRISTTLKVHRHCTSGKGPTQQRILGAQQNAALKTTAKIENHTTDWTRRRPRLQDFNHVGIECWVLSGPNPAHIRLASVDSYKVLTRNALGCSNPPVGVLRACEVDDRLCSFSPVRPTQDAVPKRSPPLVLLPKLIVLGGPAHHFLPDLEASKASMSSRVWCLWSSSITIT